MLNYYFIVLTVYSIIIFIIALILNLLLITQKPIYSKCFKKHFILLLLLILNMIISWLYDSITIFVFYDTYLILLKTMTMLYNITYCSQSMSKSRKAQNSKLARANMKLSSMLERYYALNLDMATIRKEITQWHKTKLFQ